jgi:hypothetical protein
MEICLQEGQNFDFVKAKVAKFFAARSQRRQARPEAALHLKTERQVRPEATLHLVAAEEMNFSASFCSKFQARLNSRPFA